MDQLNIVQRIQFIPDTHAVNKKRFKTRDDRRHIMYTRGPKTTLRYQADHNTTHAMQPRTPYPVHSIHNGPGKYHERLRSTLTVLKQNLNLENIIISQEIFRRCGTLRAHQVDCDYPVVCECNYNRSWYIIPVWFRTKKDYLNASILLMGHKWRIFCFWLTMSQKISALNLRFSS